MSTSRQGLLGRVRSEPAPLGVTGASTDVLCHGSPDGHFASKAWTIHLSRLVFLSLIGVVEVLVLSVMVDGVGFSSRNSNSWLAPWFGHSRQIGQVLTAAAAA